MKKISNNRIPLIFAQISLLQKVLIKKRKKIPCTSVPVDIHRKQKHSTKNNRSGSYCISDIKKKKGFRVLELLVSSWVSFYEKTNML